MIIKSVLFVENPLVSVIVPSYNRTDTVGQTIDSILNQKCNFDFEIVIGDDCSTDNVRELLLEYQKKYPEKFILLFHDENIGLGANWATCVKHCRGKYIANCDNDDYWHNPNKLQLQVDFLEANLQYGVVHSDYRKHNRDSGIITDECATNSILNSEPLQNSIMNGNFRCCNATVLYRKSLIDKYINLDDYIRLHFTLQDWNTWMILANYTQFYCMPISTATFGIETESITRPTSYEEIEKRFSKEKECYQYVCNLFPANFPYVESEYDDYVSSVLLNLAFKQNDYFKARSFGKKISNKSIKVLCSQNRILFKVFVLLKRIKNN